MTSRERTFRALARQPADRIPVDFWASGGTRVMLERRFNVPFDRFLDEQDVDFRYIAGPRYVGPPLRPGCDLWGVRRTEVRLDLRHGVEAYEEVAESPLAAAQTAADVVAYPGWPSPGHFDYSGIEAQCDAVHAASRVAVFMGDRLNRIAQLKPAMYLRGMEQILTDTVLGPELAEAIFGRIRDFYRGYLERILAAARGQIDIVLTGDDFGSQNGLLMSPAAWRQFLQPGFAQYLAAIRAHGARSMHHTCGAVRDLIPDLVVCGLDILQSVQPEAAGMDLGGLLRDFGDRLCFQGGISIQRTMPFGDPAAVRAEVRRIAELVQGRGGYIFCTAHNIQADTPLENVMALLEAYREYGRGAPPVGLGG